MTDTSAPKLHRIERHIRGLKNEKGFLVWEAVTNE